MMRRSCATQKFSLCEVLVGWWGGVGGKPNWIGIQIDVLWWSWCSMIWKVSMIYIYIYWVVYFRTIGQNKIQHSNRWYIYKWFHFPLLPASTPECTSKLVFNFEFYVGFDWCWLILLQYRLHADKSSAMWCFETAVSSAGGSISKVSFCEPFLQQHRPQRKCCKFLKSKSYWTCLNFPENNIQFLSFSFQGKSTLHETNIVPENGWLEYFPFGMAYFQVLC